MLIKTLTIFIFFSIALQFNCNAIDLDGDFSSRSLIFKEQNKKTNYSEYAEILKSKKLTPTINCLVEQIKKNNIENIELLIKAGVDINSSYYTDYPIYIAAKENNFEVLKLLHQNKAKLDKGFYSELYEATKNKNTQMALYLIENGSNINYIDIVTSNSILYYAIKNNLEEVTKKLIEKKVNVDLKSLKLIKKKKLNFSK